jgi:hypothetical protein
LVTLSVGVTNMCDDYDVDDKNVLKFADTRALDIHKLGPATFNAIEEIVGMDYDRSALIPEVTGIVRSVSDKMTQDVSKSGKAVVCDRYGKQLIGAGFLRRNGGQGVIKDERRQEQPVDKVNGPLSTVR